MTLSSSQFEPLGEPMATVLNIAINSCLVNLASGDSDQQAYGMSGLTAMINLSPNFRFHVIDTLLAAINNDLEVAGLLILDPDPGRQVLFPDPDPEVHMSLSTYSGDWDKAPEFLKIIRGCLVGMRELKTDESIQVNIETLKETFGDENVFPEMFGSICITAAWAHSQRENADKLAASFDAAVEAQRRNEP